MEGSIKLLNYYIRELHIHPQYFTNAHPRQIEHVTNSNLASLLPHRDQYGRRVFIFRVKDWSPESVPINDFYAISFMMAELAAIEPKTQVAGVTAIWDVDGMTMKMMKSVNMEDEKNISVFLTVLQYYIIVMFNL